MAKETILALYDSLEHANLAVRDLLSNGFERSNIGLAVYDREKAQMTQSDIDVSGEEGAGFGALVGGLTGLVAGLTAILVPGVGPVIAAGPLAAILGGATGVAIGTAAGAVTGGITASLINLGVPEDYAGYYAEAVRRGSALVTITTENRVSEAMSVLRQHNPMDIERRAFQWRKHGWQGFDPMADPYTAVDLAKEPDLYAHDVNIETAVRETDDMRVRRYPTKLPY